MNNDVFALILSFTYAGSLLVLSEILMRKCNWQQFVTRKLVHIGAGMWIWGILYFFDNWYFGIIPFATFIVLNFIIYKYEILKGVEKEDSSPGTVYFAISITILFALFWRTNALNDKIVIAAAAVMSMTWGDAMASLVGKTLGKHHYTFFGHTRSYEGSFAMFIASFIAVYLTLAFLPGSELTLNSAAVNSLIPVTLAAAVTSTLAEAVSPAGTDNLSVPLLVGLVLWLLI